MTLRPDSSMQPRQPAARGLHCRMPSLEFPGVQHESVRPPAKWFKPWGWIYRSISWRGILVSLVALASSVQVLLAVDRRSHSVSDTLYGVFPYVVPCWTLAYWIATKTCRTER